MRIMSPWLMNSGTLISAPVSSVAGLVALVAVSPLNARISLGNFQLNKVGRLYAEYVALIGQNLNFHVLLNELECRTQLGAIDRLLLIGLHVHEVVQIAVAVQILHILALDISGRILISRVERTLYHCASDNILILGADESGTLTRLNVLEFDNLYTLPSSSNVIPFLKSPAEIIN